MKKKTAMGKKNERMKEEPERAMKTRTRDEPRETQEVVTASERVKRRKGRKRKTGGGGRGE